MQEKLTFRYPGRRLGWKVEETIIHVGRNSSYLSFQRCHRPGKNAPISDKSSGHCQFRQSHLKFLREATTVCIKILILTDS